MHDSFTSQEKIDRREIYRKLQKHRQESKLRRSAAIRDHDIPDDEEDEDNVLLEDHNASLRSSYGGGGEIDYSEHYSDPSVYHEEEGAIGEEDYEAMNQALSSPPVAWWQMRKQWQNKPNVARLLGRMASGMDEEEGDDIDSSYRVGNLTERTALDGGVVGHPVMLADPRSMGYDHQALRQNPFADEKEMKKKGKYRNMVIYVPKSVVQKRRINQLAYLAGTVCAIILFIFFLEECKLSHYSLVESPMSLSAYLAGELMNPSERVSVENVQLIPVPKAKRTSLHEENLVKGGANLRSAADFSFSSVRMHSSQKYESIRSLLVAQAITQDETFNYEHTPQAQALHWMAYEDLHPGLPLGFGHDELAAKKLIQRYALAVMYYATNGPGWNNQINFLSDKDECEWNALVRDEQFFIGAGECDEKGFVTALALWSNNLVGALPEELGTLSTIATFSLYDNNMRGPPPKILRKLHGLKVLYLNKNEFVGDLDFMCDLKIETMKADCGEAGGVVCSCCTTCGWRDES